MSSLIRTAFVAVLVAVFAGCMNPWFDCPDSRSEIADRELEAFLLLDSIDASQSMLALIQLQRSDRTCAVCTLESHIEQERRTLRHLLERGLPPIATERAKSRLHLLDKYRQRAPFDEDACPLPCNSVE